MSEEKKPSSPAEKPASATRYLAILFLAAFCLLLVTLAMERRQHQVLQEQSQEQIHDLQQNISAVQSLQNLYDENAALKEKLHQMELDLQELNNALLDTEANLFASNKTVDTLDKTVAAMDWFWQIDEAYVRGRYTVCKQLIDRMTELGLEDYLPLESTTNTDRFSPAHRLEEIREKLEY